MLGKKVGILGGGQLGRMLALAAQPMGIHVAILDPLGAHSPAGMVSHVAHLGDFKNAEKILEFVEKVKPDVLTVEIEHVNVVALETVQKAKGIVIQPSPSTIRVIQDKFLQKIHLRNHGVQLPDFQAAEGKGEIEEVGKKFGYPLMLKSRKLAYDGRGNAVVKNPDEIEKALGSLVSNEVYIEKWVHFQKELAVIVVRGIDGTVISYPTVETIQKDSMCDKVIAPAQIHPSAAVEARRLAEKAVATLEGAGVFGVELFLLDDGSVLLNEIAPRVHNSGHFTIEASETSQFENHVRAVLGLPLGSTAMRVGAAMMVNVIGNGNQEETFAPCIRALSVAGASVHWYSKGEAKKARKMGHITIVGGDFSQVLERFKSVTLEEEGPRPLPVVGVIMGSDSDLPIMKPAAVTLREFGVPFELTVVSAHRTPERMMEYAKNAHLRGLKVIIAAAGGAAHLPGMVAAITPLPVIGVPRALSYLDGQDSLYSIVQMPSGVPVATVAINNSTNAALLAIRILGGPYTLKMAEYQRHLELQVIQKVERLEEEGWEKYGAKKE